MKLPAILVALLMISGSFLMLATSGTTSTTSTTSFTIPSGDWTIAPGESITVDGETIDLKGNLTIESGGSLTLRGGSKLIMNSTYSGQYSITVKEGGTFNVVDSEISAPEKDYKGKIRYDLHQGPNLISIPFERDNNSVESVLSPIDGEYYKAYVYDVSDRNDPWKFYTPGMKGSHADEMPSYTWRFHTENTTPPSVLCTIPENAAENISKSTYIKVVFDKSMDPSRVPVVDQLGGDFSKNWTFVGWNSTFLPNDTCVWEPISILPNAYTVNLTISNFYDAEGLMGNNFSFEFSINSNPAFPPLKVRESVPSKGNISVNPSIDVSIVFNTTVGMNTTAIPKIDTILGTDTGGWTFLGWSSSYVGNDTATWSHAPWKSDEHMILKVYGEKDINGYYGDTFYLDFKTVDLVNPGIKEVYPLPQEYSVSNSSVVFVVFNETMDSSATPSISQTEGTDPGNWTFLGWKSTYLPNDTAVWSHNPWDDFDSIQLTVYNYTDLAGNSGPPYSWQFRTGDSRTPAVVQVMPQNLEVRTKNSTEIRVVFDSSMNTRVIPEINCTDTQNLSFVGWGSTYLPDDTAIWTHGDWPSDSDITITVSNYSDLSEISPEQAILVYLYENYSFELSGTVESSVSQHLYPGWNTVAYPFIDNSTVGEVFSSISSYYDSVKTYDSHGNETYLNDTDKVEGGMGYWVHVSEDCLWYVSAYSLLDLESIFPKFDWVYENGSSGNVQNSVISGCGHENSEFPGLSVFSDLVKIGNNEIRNSYAGIYIKDASPIISGNSIYNTHYGIISESASPIISGNKVYNNKMGGILIKSGYPIISSNTISFNIGDGISLYDSNSIMEANDVESNLGDGIFLNNSSLRLGHSIIRYNKNGIRGVASNISAKDNTIDGNVVGIRASQSYVTIEGNTMSLNKNSIVVENGTEGRIANNSLSSAERGHISCLNSTSIEIYGNIIISGDTGIYVSESSPSIEKNLISQNKGSGIYLQKNSNSRIRYNIISGNGWAGIYVDGAEPIIENNTMSSNDFGIASFNATCYIYNSSILSNKWYGLSFIYSDVIVENSILKNNKWYGALTSYSSFTMRNVSIENSTYQLYMTHNSRGESINSSISGESCHLDYSSILFVKYFLNIHVKDTLGNGISNVTYTIDDKDGYSVSTGRTRYGKALYIPLTSYIRMSGGVFDTENPYNLTVSWKNRSFSREFYLNSSVYEDFVFPAINYSAKEDCGKKPLFNIYDWLPYENNATFAINGSVYTGAFVKDGRLFIDPVANWNGVERIVLKEIKSNTTVGEYVFFVNIEPVNDAPVLEGESAAYSSGEYTIFKVVYEDVDNDAPQYVDVVIDGKPHPMIPENPSDYDYKDGKVYIYKAKLENGDYTYYFECSDGKNTTKTQSVKLKVEHPISLPLWAIYALLFLGIVMVLYVGVRIRRLKKRLGEDIEISINDESKTPVHMLSSIDTRRSVLHRKYGVDTSTVGLDSGSTESRSTIDRSIEKSSEVSEAELEKTETPPSMVAQQEAANVAEAEPEKETMPVGPLPEAAEEKKRKFTRERFMEIARKHKKMRVLLEDREKYARLEPDVEPPSEGEESIDEILKTLKGE